VGAEGGFDDGGAERPGEEEVDAAGRCRRHRIQAEALCLRREASKSGYGVFERRENLGL
jgi:hypothetical protein